MAPESNSLFNSELHFANKYDAALLFLLADLFILFLFLFYFFNVKNVRELIL